MLPAEHVERANCGHCECTSQHGASHVVRVLPPRPLVKQQGRETGEVERSVSGALIADWVLHPCVGGDDEVSGNPRANEHSHSSEPVLLRRETLFTVEEQAQERRLEEEREHAFHGEGLADYASGELGEVRPVRPEMEFHGNSGYHARNKIDSENLRPEPGRLVVHRIA